ncbi:MAG: CehA/McbA family metallohydrolase [Acidobacteriota bacterium]
MRRRSVIRIGLAAWGLAGAIAIWGVAGLPPRPAPPVGMPVASDVRVAYHVHTRASDGTGTIETVAAAAQRAGLAAVIVTDHGDGTRAVPPPRYVSKVLVVEGAEISTWAGHYVALGAAPAPYPLGGEPAAVVDDVHRLGGLGLAAHPGSAKEALKWRDWDASFDGLEWLNADSEWRDRPRDLWRSLVTYPWRPVETITALLDRPAFELAQWDRLTARRPVAGLVAHDAHARLGVRGVGEPYDGAVALSVPSYAAIFAAFSNVARLERPLTGDAAADAVALVHALGTGRSYGVVTGIAPSGHVRFTATAAGASAGMGEHLAPTGPVVLTFAADAPAGARATLLCNGRVVAEGDGGQVAWTTASAPGACRVEVTTLRGDTRVPWLFTNPIYVRDVLAAPSPQDLATAKLVLPVAWSGDADKWQPELAPGASGRAAAVPGHPRRVAFTWQLGSEAEQHAALRLDIKAPDLTGFDRLVVRASADRPMRAWLQLRTPQGSGQRWGRSVYLDPTMREIPVSLDSLLALDGASTPVPLADVTALLIVVDTVHTRPGTAGTIYFDELWKAR